jgi:transcriptional regulator with XRE-family HTH domain
MKKSAVPRSPRKQRGLSESNPPVHGAAISSHFVEPGAPIKNEPADSAMQSRRSDDLQIGGKLRHARMVRKLRLKDLAERVGCSESMLSKVENDQVRPSLKILHRIAAELNTSIGALFSGADDRNKVVMRRSERPVIRTNVIGRPGAAGVRLECLVPDPENRLLYGSIHVVEPGGGSEGAIEHQGEEIGYVLEGELDLTVDSETFHLFPGDSFFFDSSLPHGYRNPGQLTAKVIWINTPPTF